MGACGTIPRLPLLLRALALLAATASALTLFVIELRVKSPLSMVANNDLTHRNRQLAIAQMLAAAALVFLVGGVYAWRARYRTAPWLRWLAHLTSPLLLLPFVPALLLEGYAELPVLVAAYALFLLVLERLWRLSFNAWLDRQRLVGPPWITYAGLALAGLARRLRPPPAVLRALPWVLLIAGMAFYAIYMGTHSIWHHRKFGTMGYDLGQYDAMMYSTLQGKPMRCAPLGLEEAWSNLRAHADFGIILVLPFYALWKGAETILIFQAIVLALGALPLFLFARRRLPEGWALVVAYAYLCYPPLHGANFYDFHLQPVAAVLIMAAIYCAEARRWVLYGVFVGFAMICREDISIGLCILGLFMLLSGWRPRAGVVTAAVAAAYFVVMRFAVMPSFGPWWFSDMYKDLYPAGDHSFKGVIRTLISNPAYVVKTLLTADKLRYALQVMAPLLFLPVRRSWLVPSILMGSLVTLLTTGYPPTIDVGFQYIGHFIPYVFPALVVALQVMGAEPAGGPARLRAAGTTLAIATVMASIMWGAFSPRETVRGGFGWVTKAPPGEVHIKKRSDLHALAAEVPFDARLAVSDQELPHLSTRMNIFSLRDGLFDCEYLLYDVGGLGANHGEEALRSGDYELVEERGSLKLLRRVKKP